MHVAVCAGRKVNGLTGAGVVPNGRRDGAPLESAMLRITVCAATLLTAAGCESTPRPTTAEGTAGIGALTTESARCQELGLTPGSAEMVECMRAGQAAPAS